MISSHKMEQKNNYQINLYQQKHFQENVLCTVTFKTCEFFLFRQNKATC